MGEEAAMANIFAEEKPKMTGSGSGNHWGGSSAGRASRSQCEGREFEPPPLHQINI